METQIKYTEKPKLKDALLIEGLPGFGQVGRLTAEHMIKEFGGKKFAELYSPHFPPQVLIQNDGSIEMITNTFYYIKKGKKMKRDIVLVVGEAQGATITGQYDICEKILDLCQEVGVNEIVTIGGYATGMLLKEPKVYGASNSKKMIKEYGTYNVIFKTKGNRGGIVGASGLLVGLSKLRKMNAVCLMGETPGHPLLIDAKAAEEILRVLEKKLNIKIDMRELDKRAKDLEKFRLGLEKMMKKMMKKERGGEEIGEGEGEEEAPAELKYIG